MALEVNMNIKFAKECFHHSLLEKLCWECDNSNFIVHCLIPKLKLSEPTLRVIRWAYGFDGSEMSYEKWSDGSSVVPDLFMGGIIKEPVGVAHDMLFRLHHEGKRDPSGKRWSLFQANLWYMKAEIEFGYPHIARARFAGLAFGSWLYWYDSRFTKFIRRILPSTK